ncbi:DUF5672 family protein [Zoogloea sp.]|uniref:DUF5672 family protein n=1 Tax=Zoogloea sp. TaxID=49181 RepID=UPI001416C083|nr:MAG: hypothetical protein F9K15_14225 [Zoogloea sp.]
MLDLPNVSLICLDTRHPNLAAFALGQCLDRANFGEALLLTGTDFTSPDPRISVRPVDILRNVADYSAFIVKQLHAQVACAHALLIQWDSFILDSSCWDPAFLDYDYIGAPWPHRAEPVGNGGFSLRSRRLLEALADPDIQELHPEDACICERYRELLETRHGIRFAPLEMARRFAFELETPKGPTFGFHGLFNFHRALPDDALNAWLAAAPAPLLMSVPARRLLKNLIRRNQHAAARHILRVRGEGPLPMKLDTCKLSGMLALRRWRGPDSDD